MTSLTLTLTAAGRAALVDAEAGGTSAIVVTEVGFSASDFVVAPTLTALPGEFKRVATVAGVAVDDTTVHLVIRDSSTDAYTVRSIALYLADGTLFAIYAQADPILGKAAVSTFLLTADLRFLPGQASLVTFGNTNFLNPPATTETMGVAYLATVAEALAGLVADKIMTPATLGEVLHNYVATAQRGVANGVAELGPDGKLALAQRPPIDLIDVWPVANQAAMLALSVATVGDMAVRADNGLVYVLQALPVSTLGNWLVLSTPAPVSSVNSKVGSVVLSAADVGGVPVGRTISGGGLVTGGGDLSANRVLSVPKATPAQALAALLDDRAVTPLGLQDLIAVLAGKVAQSRTIAGGGLVTGGGDLSADRTLAVLAATLGQLAAGGNDSAITPATLAALPKSLTANGYLTLPLPLADGSGRFPIIQWVKHRAIYNDEVNVFINWPIVYPTAVLPVSATGFVTVVGRYQDLWPQTSGHTQYGVTIQLQADDRDDNRIDGFDIISIGF